MFAASTPEYAKSLRHALHEHRQKVYAKLTNDAGASLPEHDCLDFPETAYLFDVEEAIRGYLRRDQKADAKIAIGVHRLGTEKVLRDQCMNLGYTRIRDYCNERLGIDSNYDWYRRIGTVLEEHKDKLKAEGFFLSGQLHKLYYLPAALKRADGDAERNVVFRRLQSDSFREFKAFAEGKGEILDQPRAFTSAVVERSARALQRVAKIKERGMIPTVQEIESPGELTYITYYDAMNRPEPAADESSSETAAA